MAVKDIEFKGARWRLSYILLNNDATRNIVFLHGWGSNKELMKLAFSKTFKGFNHIYVDLPGFGGSSCEGVINTYEYAAIIESFLGALHVDSNAIIVGHSFGGKIALLLNREIILLSSAGILLPKSLKVRAKIFATKILKGLGIKHFRAFRARDADNLSPTMYEIFKIVVNEDFSLDFASFTHSSSVFWGESDKATPLTCYHKILSLMPKARGFILQGDHYFFLKQGTKIESLYFGS